jgi:hypothetical protein
MGFFTWMAMQDAADAAQDIADATTDNANINRINCLISVAKAGLLDPKQTAELKALIDKEIKYLKEPKRSSRWRGPGFW